MIGKLFTLASGSVLGRDHYISKKNNQDSHHIVVDGELIVAVVSDGCGDAKSLHSEVGAALGARLITQSVAKHAKRSPDSLTKPLFWERIRQDVLAQLRILVMSLDNSLSEVVSNFFLFTIVGVVITKDLSIFFSIGDGVIFVNGEKMQIGPFDNNAPPYLGYALLDTVQTGFNQESLSFHLHTVIETKNLASFLIGCDGVIDLINASGKNLLGKNDTVETISDFWTQPKYYSNPFALTRRLIVINNQIRLVDWDKKKVQNSSGLLPDDTTLIVGKRVETKEGAK